MLIEVKTFKAKGLDDEGEDAAIASLVNDLFAQDEYEMATLINLQHVSRSISGWATYKAIIGFPDKRMGKGFTSG